MPPSKYMGNTEDAQPGMALSLNSLVKSTQQERPKLNKKITIPMPAIKRKGTEEKEVMPSTARDSIFLTGYFDSPAKRAARSYSTMVCGKPIVGIIPRKKRLTSSYCLSASMARRLISRKSAWL